MESPTTTMPEKSETTYYPATQEWKRSVTRPIREVDRAKRRGPPRPVTPEEVREYRTLPASARPTLRADSERLSLQLKNWEGMGKYEDDAIDQLYETAKEAVQRLKEASLYLEAEQHMGQKHVQLIELHQRRIGAFLNEAMLRKRNNPIPKPISRYLDVVEEEPSAPDDVKDLGPDLDDLEPGHDDHIIAQQMDESGEKGSPEPPPSPPKQKHLAGPNLAHLNPPGSKSPPPKTPPEFSAIADHIPIEQFQVAAQDGEKGSRVLEEPNPHPPRQRKKRPTEDLAGPSLAHLVPGRDDHLIAKLLMAPAPAPVPERPDSESLPPKTPPEFIPKGNGGGKLKIRMTKALAQKVQENPKGQRRPWKRPKLYPGNWEYDPTRDPDWKPGRKAIQRPQEEVRKTMQRPEESTRRSNSPSAPPSVRRPRERRRRSNSPSAPPSVQRPRERRRRSPSPSPPPPPKPPKLKYRMTRALEEKIAEHKEKRKQEEMEEKARRATTKSEYVPRAPEGKAPSIPHPRTRRIRTTVESAQQEDQRDDEMELPARGREPSKAPSPMPSPRLPSPPPPQSILPPIPQKKETVDSAMPPLAGRPRNWDGKSKIPIRAPPPPRPPPPPRSPNLHPNSNKEDKQLPPPPHKATVLSPIKPKNSQKEQTWTSIQTRPRPVHKNAVDFSLPPLAGRPRNWDVKSKIPKIAPPPAPSPRPPPRSLNLHPSSNKEDKQLPSPPPRPTMLHPIKPKNSQKPPTWTSIQTEYSSIQTRPRPVHKNTVDFSLPPLAGRPRNWDGKSKIPIRAPPPPRPPPPPRSPNLHPNSNKEDKQLPPPPHKATVLPPIKPKNSQKEQTWTSIQTRPRPQHKNAVDFTLAPLPGKKKTFN